MAEKTYVWPESQYRDWLRVRRKVDTMNGPGVTNTPDCISIGLPSPRRGLPVTANDPPLIRICGYTGGSLPATLIGGLYWGALCTPALEITSATSGTAWDPKTQYAGLTTPDCIVANLLEGVQLSPSPSNTHLIPTGWIVEGVLRNSVTVSDVTYPLYTINFIQGSL